MSSIVAECPHCAARRTVPAELAGRMVKCGNPECRQTFVIAAAPPAPPPRPPRPARPAPPPPDPDLPNLPADPADEAEVMEAEAVEVAEASPIKEVQWSAGADLPPPPPKKGGAKPAVVAAKPAAAFEEVKDEPEEEDDWEPIARRKRKKKRNTAPLVLAVMLGATVFAVILFVVLAYRKGEEEAESAANQAKSLYDKQDYAAAEKAYQKLADDNPDAGDGDKYRFLARLAGSQKVIRSISNQEDPRPGLESYRAFVDAHKGKPFVKPNEFGNDVFDMGKKLAEDVARYADGRVKGFVADRRAKPKELDAAEEMVKAGNDLLERNDPFRPKEVSPAEGVKGELNKVSAAIGKERHRLAVVARVRDILSDPTDANIANAKVVLAAERYAADPEAAGLVTAAEGAFLTRVRYDRDPAPPQPPAEAGGASVLFVAPVGPTKPSARGPNDGPPGVFLAVARGLLYALDEDTGDTLWAARVGPAVYDPPTVARVNTLDGTADIAVVASDVAGRPAVTGYDLRTGKPLWQQPLTAKNPAGGTSPDVPAAPAGPAAVAGGRGYLPLRDPNGTVVVLDLASGARVGRMTLGQPAGPVVARPGTPLVYAAGESRRVFVFDAEAAGPDGPQPRCVRVLPTDHPGGTLRTTPVFLGPPGDDPGADHWLLLSQADGPKGMRLRAFRLDPTPPAAGDGPPPVTALSAPVELAVVGWSWFPPATDGERLAFVTDMGQLRLFGLNQVGSSDAAVFPLPSPKPEDPVFKQVLPAANDPDADRPLPGQVVPAEDGAFWVLLYGKLVKFRLALRPDTGLEATALGTPLAIGVPTQPVQTGPRRETACFVVRSANGSGCRAVAVRLADGEPRWQRQLGAVAAGPAAAAGGGLLLTGEDGSAFLLPPGLGGAGVARSAPGWVAADPPEGVAGPSATAASADGRTAFVVTPTAGATVPQFTIRRLVDGKRDHAGVVAAPGPLAGPPAVVGGSLLLPAADGFVYRLEVGDGRLRPDTLTQGPRWWSDRRAADPVGYVVPVGGDAFVTTDGGRGMARWVWPAGGQYSDGGATWRLRDRVAAAPVLVPADGARPARLLAADVSGGVGLYDAARGGEPARRWVPGRTAGLPGGRVTGLAVGAGADGRPAVVYVSDGRRLVCLDPEKDDPVWVGGAGDESGAVVGLPRPAGGGKWLVTELGGRVKVLDGATGRPVVEKDVGLPGSVPAAAGVASAAGRVVVPLSDGSAAVVEVDGIAAGPAPAPAPKGNKPKEEEE